MTDEPAAILVVANETLVGGELVAAVERRAAKGPIRVAVVAPVSQPKEGYVVYRDSRRASAGRRLERTLTALREAGIPAHGGVYDDEPLAAVKDVLASEEVDEIIVSTHPETKSGWLRKNLVEEIRRVAGDCPVEHVVADTTARTGVNVLVVANETVLGEPLLERIRERARRGDDAAFLLARERGAFPGGAARHQEVHARIDLPPRHAHKQGIERFFHALNWKEGQFELSAAEVEAEDELQLPISFVLLEHARRQDEGQPV